MRAIVNTSPGQLELQELPLPIPGPGEVRIQTVACGICATDLEMIKGWDRTGFPAIPGHEWAGIVDDVGPGVSKALVGAHVVGENVLSKGGEIGFEHPGGYAEYFITEAAKLQILPEDFPLTTATLIEPLAVCVRGFRRLRRDAEEPFLIFGDGPIGLIFLMLLVSQGKEVFMVGGRDNRLEIAKTIGAKGTINYHETDIHSIEARFPSIVEASGSPLAIEASLRLATKEARILILGDYGNTKADFPWNQLLHWELELIGSNASAGAWPEAVRIALEEVIPLDKIITHTIPIEDFKSGISLATDRSAGAIKVILLWS
jgi:2-desacetyl-2-hydroxyethyl bacteriochlorophyllide A dehydrogenase